MRSASNSLRGWRSWRQFSLRRLFVIVTLAGVLIAVARQHHLQQLKEKLFDEMRCNYIELAIDGQYGEANERLREIDKLFPDRVAEVRQNNTVKEVGFLRAAFTMQSVYKWLNSPSKPRGVKREAAAGGVEKRGSSSSDSADE